MRTGSTIKKLITATLVLGVAVAVAASPVGPGAPSGTAGIPVAVAVDAPAGPQGPVGVDGAKDTGGKKKKKSGGNTGQNTEGNNVDPITGTEVKKTSVIQYVNAVYVWFAFIGGLLAVISLIYAGYSYMGSYGDPEKISNAKDVVEKALIGLSLLILAALILNTINPRTVENPCTPGEAGCGDIDFTKPGG
ncbi:MAG: pilin [bacterium]|nr:pilin [bacterium]